MTPEEKKIRIDRLMGGLINKAHHLYNGGYNDGYMDAKQTADEAYQKGVEYGKGICAKCAEKCDDCDYRKEDYQRGLEDGKKQANEEKCDICTEEANKDIQDAYQRGAFQGYQEGLNDTWEAARKIVGQPSSGYLSCEDLCTLFNTADVRAVFFNHTASEAVEKLKTWEQKQDEIRVGDIITDQNENEHYLVFAISDKSYNCLSGKDFEPVYIGKDYISQYHNMKDRKDLKLVAAELLKQMKGKDNG